MAVLSVPLISASKNPRFKQFELLNIKHKNTNVLLAFMTYWELLFLIVFPKLIVEAICQYLWLLILSHIEQLTLNLNFLKNDLCFNLFCFQNINKYVATNQIIIIKSLFLQYYIYLQQLLSHTWLFESMQHCLRAWNCSLRTLRLCTDTIPDVSLPVCLSLFWWRDPLWQKWHTVCLIPPSMCSTWQLNKRCFVAIIEFWRFVVICVSGLRLRASVWRRFSLRRHLWPIISLVTPPSATNTWLKTCSTVITTRQPITPLTQPTAPWHRTAPRSDLHPATTQAQIQFRQNRDWTVRSWTRQRGSASWGPDWTPRVVGVRDRRTLLLDTVVRTTQIETLMWKYICWIIWWLLHI